MMRKDGGSIGRARHAPVLLALALAACAGDEVAGDPGQPTGCPEVLIVQGLGELTEFREGRGRDLTDMVSRGRILDYAGQCEYVENGVVVDLDLTIGAEQGPAATDDTADFTYFVATTDPEQNILAKELFETEVVFADGATRAGSVEELQLSIPLDQAAAASLPRTQVEIRHRPLRERPRIRASARARGAEGANAPETLRQKDRKGRRLWKAGDGGFGRAASPKE